MIPFKGPWGAWGDAWGKPRQSAPHFGVGFGQLYHISEGVCLGGGLGEAWLLLGGKGVWGGAGGVLGAICLWSWIDLRAILVYFLG